jgi:hypothetical protein
MRFDNMFEIRLLKRPHKFFVYWIGRPDYHIMDWLGCNFHWVKAEGQPKGGFDTPWDAWMWADKRNVLQRQEVMQEISPKSGTHLSDFKDYFTSELQAYPFGDEQRRFRVNCPLYCDEHNSAFMYPPDEWWDEFDAWMKKKQGMRKKK